VPETFTAKVTENIWRPTLTVLWPLYTGGLSDATQSAAEAGARQAEAELVATSDALTLQLVVAYFGQQVAAHTLETSRQNLARFQTHLDNALKMETQGLLSKAQRLQMQVARDAAERQALRAQNDYETALSVLTRTLNESRVVQPLTPLFASSVPLAPMQGFVDTGRTRSPTVARLIALREVADSGVKAAEAASLPRLYGFGSYNFNANHAVLPDPDWIVGVGLHYPIFSNVDRKQAESAARARQQQAQTTVDQARNDVETLIVRSYQGVETARRQFLLLSSNIEAAEENVRVQTIGFREGEAGAASLIDAQVALSIAQTQRAAAAFEYDVSLARLLAASGQMGEYGRHVAAADHRVPLP